jgi:hypothetical protein
MTRTFQTETTILPGNRIEITSPELPAGSKAKVVVTLVEPEPVPLYKVYPELAAAERRYYADLPEMLRSKPGRWVAYTSQGCVAEGEDWAAVFKQCQAQGLERGSVLIWRVEPNLPVLDAPRDWVVDE